MECGIMNLDKNHGLPREPLSTSTTPNSEEVVYKNSVHHGLTFFGSGKSLGLVLGRYVHSLCLGGAFLQEAVCSALGLWRWPSLGGKRAVWISWILSTVQAVQKALESCVLRQVYTAAFTYSARCSLGGRVFHTARRMYCTVLSWCSGLRLQSTCTLLKMI